MIGSSPAMEGTAKETKRTIVTRIDEDFHLASFVTGLLTISRVHLGSRYGAKVIFATIKKRGGAGLPVFRLSKFD